MCDSKKIAGGFQAFHNKYFRSDNPLFKKLGKGQYPATMVISCADSRVDPSLLLNTRPGDLFVLRNVANLVPSYQEASERPSVGAAIEFAVKYLKVKNIVIIGHSDCGGIQALLKNDLPGDEFILPWVSSASVVRDKINEFIKDENDNMRACAAEQASLILSLENLLGYPFVLDAVREDRLKVFGWYFDIESGDLLEYNQKDDVFVKITWGGTI